ncbi:hypothetical protein MJD09_19030, partial [bacterium]|nr:hypothetical protein [bacterium]
NMHMTATTAEWFKKKGRHKIYAAGRNVELATTEHTMQIVDVDKLKEEASADNQGANGTPSNGNGVNGNGRNGVHGHTKLKPTVGVESVTS